MSIQQVLDYYSDKHESKINAKLKKYQKDYHRKLKEIKGKKEIIKKKNKEYYQKNKEIRKAYQKAYRMRGIKVVKTQFKLDSSLFIIKVE